MTYSGPLSDRLEIRELIETYADAVNRHDVRAWAGTWAEDAQWIIRDEAPIGRPAISELWQRKMRRFSLVAFSVQIGSIEVRGEDADARVSAIEDLWLEPSGCLRVHGRYDDRLTRRNGRWLFARRSYTVLRQGEMPVGGGPPVSPAPSAR
jgi:uncharacterized protein (TIGR02246 family)